MADELWRMSAGAAVAKLKSGEIAPVELLQSIEARVSSVDPLINALPTLCFERACEYAAKLAASPVEERGALAGLPFAIKDSYDVSGVRTTYGSLAYADHIPDRSDYVVEAIEAEGGLVYAKSNTPEFEAGANTFNEVFGRTLNPWNLALSAAGSSGGAAAAVATGMAFIAQGSDFACSLRFPAAFCNVVGLRPSPGIVPQGPNALPYQVLSVLGPMARTVADVGLGLDAMARFDPRDPLTRPRSDRSYGDAAATPRPPKLVAASADLGFCAIDRKVRAAFEAVISTLEDSGISVACPRLPFESSRDAFVQLRAFQFAAMRADALRDHRDRLKPEVVWNIESGLRLQAMQIAEAEALRARIRRDFLGVLNSYEFLITPTAPVPPYPVESRYVDEIDGQKQETYLDWMALGYAITLTGCPAISIPCGRTADGLPLGLQIVGPPYAEAKLLAAAAFIETVLDASLAEPMDPVPAAVL